MTLAPKSVRHSSAVQSYALIPLKIWALIYSLPQLPICNTEAKTTQVIALIKSIHDCQVLRYYSDGGDHTLFMGGTVFMFCVCTAPSIAGCVSMTGTPGHYLGTNNSMHF